MSDVNPYGTTQVVELTFPNNTGSATVVISTYEKMEGEYHLEKGLDGACNGAVQNIKGLILEYIPTALGEYPSRQFRFQTDAYGEPVSGRGRAIGVAPATIIVAMTFAKDQSGAEAMSDAFVESFSHTPKAGQ